ncbi:MAG TPA: tetratricopeptide repeat protein [Ktedonobacterales bacterium]|jgi:tetratricopeptide (TPR) repeat protein|nr:tetratricopeptide repeat protein [Ktedonobacterales bacterium]
MLSTAERQAAERILELLDSHTLALRLAGAYAADTRQTLTAVAAELETAPAGGAPDKPSKAVSAAFYQSANDLPVEGLRLFGLLAAFATANVGRNAVLEVGETLAIGQERERLEQLINRAFVETGVNPHLPITADYERVQVHPLLRGFAETMFQTWSEDDRNAAYRAVALYYAEYANATPDRWLGPDEANIVGALQWAHKRGEQESVAALCAGLQYYWRDRGRIPASKSYLPWGIEAAEAIAESIPPESPEVRQYRRRAAQLALSYGNALKESGELDTAEGIFQRNLLLRRQLGDRRGEGRALCCLGLVTQAQGKLGEAERYYQDALDISIAEGDRQSEGANLTYLGQVAQARGHISVAEKRLRKALEIFREVGDPHGEGVDLTALARLALEKRDFAEAEALAQQSLAIRRDMEDTLGEGAVLSLQGRIGLARGDLEVAEEFFHRSLEIRHKIEDRVGEADDLTQLGRLYLDRGKYDESERYFQDALGLFRTVHARAQEGVVLSQLGLVAIERGQRSEGKRLLSQSIPIRGEVRDRRGEGVDLALLGRIELERRHYHKAKALYEQSLEIARNVQNERGVGVNLRQLGVIAEKQGRIDEAEVLYRQALDIARNVENGLDIADTCLALGSLLCAKQQTHSAGCPLIHESIRTYARIGAPGEQTARQEAIRWGCD